MNNSSDEQKHSRDKRQVRVKTSKGVIGKQDKPIIQRDKTIKVRDAKGRRLSSTLWLQRQLNDPYVAAAKEHGYRSRAAFKLFEINEKFSLLKAGMTVIDLGAAPGGWSQICADRVDSLSGKGRVIAMDIQEMAELPGVEFFHCDFTQEDVPVMLQSLVPAGVDLVISDMAPFTTGVQSADHLRILNLVELAVEFSIKVLRPKGVFVSKLFEGGGGGELLAKVKKHFAKVGYFKPKSSRSDSTEIFLVAQGFLGR